VIVRGGSGAVWGKGEEKTVEFTIKPEMLSVLNEDMRNVVEPSVFELMVGLSSDHTDKVLLTVTGVNGETRAH